MSLNEKFEEYIDIVNSGLSNIQQQVLEKMMQEESAFSQGRVRKLIKRIKKETGVVIDETEIWNEVRDG